MYIYKSRIAGFVLDILLFAHIMLNRQKGRTMGNNISPLCQVYINFKYAIQFLGILFNTRGRLLIPMSRNAYGLSDEVSKIASYMITT